VRRTRLAQRRRTVGLTQEMLAEQLGVDRTTIIRWECGQSAPLPWHRPNLATALQVSAEEVACLLGDAEPHPDEVEQLGVVAAVLSDAWGIPAPDQAAPAGMRRGEQAMCRQPCSAAGTLKELGIFLRSDMLTRRETLAQGIKAVSGAAMVAPIAGWLDAPPTRLEPRSHGTQRISASDVEVIERSTRFFAAMVADTGGALSREAAVGQLKCAVDLARQAVYSDAVGNRLLAAIAELSGLVGYACHDSGMAGSAQRYFTYGLQAARESTDPRARLLVVSILADMGEHFRWHDRPDSALKFIDLAISHLPTDRRLDGLRALIVARRAGDALGDLGPSHLPEVRNALGLAFDLYGRASKEDNAAASSMWHRVMDVSEHELAPPAAAAYVAQAKHDPRLAVEAEKYTLQQLTSLPEGQSRSNMFAHLRLAKIRFLAGEAEQACDDGDQALDIAPRVTSTMIQIRLRDLLAVSKPLADVARVVEFRHRLRETLARLN
jgi:DNA-binding XRE family transcriptional regulator